MAIIGNRAQSFGFAPPPQAALPDDILKMIAEQEARDRGPIAPRGANVPISEGAEPAQPPRMGFIGASAPISPITAVDVNQRVAPKKPGWNEPGGMNEGLQKLAASLMDAGGNSEGSNSILQELQREQERRDGERDRSAQIARQNRPEGVSLGNGAYGQYDPVSGGLKMLREATPPVQRETPLERNIKLYKQYNPDATPEQIADMVQRGAGGFQYSQPYLEQKNDFSLGQIRQRADNARNLKRIPSYANLHPRLPAARRPATVKAPAASRGASNVAEGTIIRNPSTGQRMRLQGGKWAPIK